MGGQHYPLPTRRTAVEAWYAAGKPPLERLDTAVHMFRTMLPPEQLPSNPSEFVHIWVTAWIARGCVRSRSTTPRRSVVDDATAKECVNQLKAGYKAEGRHKSFTSLKQAAAKNDYIKHVLASSYGPNGLPITHCTLWRRMKAVDPTLTRRTLRYTWPLSCIPPSAEQHSS